MENYPQIIIAANIPNTIIVYKVPTAAVDSSKNLSDIILFFSNVTKKSFTFI